MGVIVLWPELFAQKYIMAFDKTWLNKSCINKSMPNNGGSRVSQNKL